jgi:hypothetical protein
MTPNEPKACKGMERDYLGIVCYSTRSVAIYRYSEDGIKRIARRALIQSLILATGMVLTVFAILAVSSGLRQALLLSPLFVSLGGLFWWRQSRSDIRSLLRATEFEFDDSELTGRNSKITTTIRCEDLVELKYHRDGLVVFPRDLRQAVQLKPELQGFDDLVQSIEKWAPPEIPRTKASTTLSFWVMGFALANLPLLVAAFTVTNPTVGMMCCITEAVLLSFCIGWVWLGKKISRRSKLQMLIVIFPMIALIQRAYELSQSR